MNKIKVLDDLTIQKIAAGEVVERPASIVKELVENSLDAGASDITVEIKEGGKTYIRVTDTGSGIDEADIDLAFMRHSTSKLSKIEDLYEIRSLGFRGEALSSISNVARVQLFTKTELAKAGVKAEIEEGKVVQKSLVGTPKGTTIIVRDLFYNIPVRREFLKSDLVESNRISDVVYKAALGAPDVNFKFIKDGNLILNTFKNNNLRNHIYSILGRDFAKNLLALNFENQHVSIKGFISNNHLYRGNRSHQYLYVNNRYVENMTISKNIEDMYKSTIPLNRFPIYILFLEIDPGEIDVNIHPTKQEIKFLEEDKVIDAIRLVISSKLKEEFSVPEMGIRRPKKESKKDDIPSLFNLFDSKDIANEEDQEVEVLDQNRNLYIKESIMNKEDLEKSKVDKAESEKFFMDISETYEGDKFKEEIQVESQQEPIDETIARLELVGIVFNTYIIARDDFNRSIYFIDQHAAHERVMYEKYLKEYKMEKIYTQQLLAPEVIKLTSSELDKLEENLSLFKKLGFEIESFGHDSIVIRGVPLVFGRPNIKDLFLEVLDKLDMNIKNNYDLKLSKIMKIACVNSVKGGDSLNEDEVRELFNQLKETKHPYSCPHGRPTMLKMTERDIEKEFLRIV